MESNPEKRCEHRQSCDADIEWTYFNRGDCFSARLLNFSKGGGYFISSQPLTPGATVLIRVRDFSPADSKVCDIGTTPRMTALGEVKWCREISGGAAARFGIGVRYHFPV